MLTHKATNWLFTRCIPVHVIKGIVPPICKRSNTAWHASSDGFWHEKNSEYSVKCQIWLPGRSWNYYLHQHVFPVIYVIILLKVISIVLYKIPRLFLTFISVFFIWQNEKNLCQIKKTEIEKTEMNVKNNQGILYKTILITFNNYNVYNELLSCFLSILSYCITLQQYFN